MLIIDEAQNLPLQVLEQIRILSNLETDKEKLLQIILVGQLNLQTLLRSPELRQLDQRVSIRYQLTPLDAETVAAYVSHRLSIAGGSASVTFTAKALDLVHRLSGGIPRLINLICDRALLAGFSGQTSRITPDIVTHAAVSLDLQAPVLRRPEWLRRRSSLLAAAAVVLLASALAVGATAYLYERFAIGTVHASVSAAGSASLAGAAVRGRETGRDRDERPPLAVVQPGRRELPTQAAYSVLVGSFQVLGADGAAARREGEVRSLTEWLEASGFPVYYADVDLGPRGRWQRVLAGAYTDAIAARVGEATLRQQGADARVVTVEHATGGVSGAAAAALPRPVSSRQP